MEAFLWGAGTAIGELPPYFVARAASAAGGMDEELEEIFDDEGGSSISADQGNWIDRGKKKLAVFLKSYAFVTVLAMASVSTSFSVSLTNHGSPLYFEMRIDPEPSV